MPMQSSEFGMRLVLLGTAGGAATYPVAGAQHGVARQGIASALVIDGRVHLVDAGQGVARQLTFADIGAGGPTQALSRLHSIYLTHLHSDHTMDLVNLLHCGYVQGWPERTPVEVYGPGPRGAVPCPRATGPRVVGPTEPTPGTTAFVRKLIEAFAADFNDRVFAAHRRDPSTLVSTHDVALPVAVDRDRRASLTVDPWVVAEDDAVRVTATLVEHGAMFPCLAYRFDTAHGSVVFSGDTVPSENLVMLSRGADVLVHEVIDARYAEWQFGPGPYDAVQQRAVATVMSKHTSTDDVGSVAQAADVGTLVLTHLVPASVPTSRWEAAVRGFDGPVVVGEDLMELDIAHVRSTTQARRRRRSEQPEQALMELHGRVPEGQAEVGAEAPEH
jgi:ribonuclease BN (tRNA processing enzyme)